MDRICERVRWIADLAGGESMLFKLPSCCLVGCSTTTTTTTATTTTGRAMGRRRETS
jgi:hypothetical protein